MNELFTDLESIIREAEEKGWVTRTFRRLDPQKKEVVITAILAEASERGPAEMNIKNIAERGSIPVGSLYQYFSSREKLLDFTLELVVRQTAALFESYTAELNQLPLRDALAAYLGGGVSWSEEQLGMVRLFGQAAYQNATGLNERVVAPIATALTNMMRSMLLAARERGEIRADLDLEVVTRLLNSQIIVLGDAMIFPHLNTYYQLYGEDMTLERVLAGFFDLLENPLFIRSPQ